MKNNILKSGELHPCTSCQLCACVCPTKAIDIRLNQDGFYRPYIDDDRCINCGICVQSCYKFDSEVEITPDVEKKALYGAWAKDAVVVKETTSGGIADVLVRELVSQGYKCIGVKYDPLTNTAKGCVATTIEETHAFRGSKYLQSLSVDTFKELVKTSKTEKYAIFGLPCQIYALDRLLRRMCCRDNHILIDLFCHGCPSLNAWKKYIDEIVAKYSAKSVISVNFRSKIRGWGNFYVVEVVVEGVEHPVTIKSPRIGDNFYELFFSDQILNDSCPSCTLRSTLEYTDIRLGDFWGNLYLHNHKGVSGICICSEKGELLYDQIRENIFSEKQPIANFLSYQSYGKTYAVNIPLRQSLLSNLSCKESTLTETLRILHRQLTIKQKFMRWGKNLLKLTSPTIISLAKMILYGLFNSQGYDRIKEK